MTAAKGKGTKRERRPGVWEIRVSAGTDPVTGRTLQRSVTFHGPDADAEVYRAELAAEYAARRSVTRSAPMLTVGGLLERWLLADHPWKPSTRIGYASVARRLRVDSLASVRVVSLTPHQLRGAIARWHAEGASLSVVGGRFRVLRSAVGWAYDERIIDQHPIRAMRGPSRPEPRKPLADNEVRALLATAETRLLAAVANDHGTLASLRFEDLAGHVLQIQRSVSGSEITLPKSGRPRTLTLGTQTARLWHTLEADWRERAEPGGRCGPWVFARDHTHHQRLSTGVLDRRFRNLRADAGAPGASLHRFRHSVATFLVERGEILQAQARLGHRDPSTTLREYAYALPQTDGDIADAIDRHLDGVDEIEQPLARDADTI